MKNGLISVSSAPAIPAQSSPAARWTSASARALYELPFNDLLFRAHSVHRENFGPNRIQLSKLLSIKTGGCSEDCSYCSQSARYPTGLTASKLMEVEHVLSEARKAKEGGVTRYCMGAAWRSPKQRDMEIVVAMVQGVKALGLETCMTLGMLSPRQADSLAEAGLDYYNHNIDTSERFYPTIITTRTFRDRLETLENVRQAVIKVCAGGIVGMGETAEDRIDMLVTLANLPSPPENVPINMLIPIPGSKLADAPPVDPIEFIRIIALARILIPASHVRLSAGRKGMSDELQALCFFAGANSIFVGDTLLTAANPGEDRDSRLLHRLGLLPEVMSTIEMMPERLARYETTLGQLERKGRRRSLARQSGIDFTSNDYLALAGSARLKASVISALDRGVPVGAGGSRLLRGNHPEHEVLEEEAAAFFRSERMLYFGSGYTANVAILSTLPQRNDLVVYDELIHASAHAGIAAGRATAVAVPHNDLDAFEGVIRKWREEGGKGHPWIVVESLYSMDGDRAPLAGLADVSDRYDGFLLIDEAHATGVHGAGGRGFSAELEGRDNVVVLHTCGKSLGVSGALVGGSRILCDYLINHARPFIYATAPSPLAASSVREALRILSEEPERRHELHRLIGYANEQIVSHLGIEGSGSQIVPVILGDSARTLRVAQQMQADGFDIRAIRPPTVPANTARLRIAITLNVDHPSVSQMFKRLAQVMAKEQP